MIRLSRAAGAGLVRGGLVVLGLLTLSPQAGLVPVAEALRRADALTAAQDYAGAADAAGNAAQRLPYDGNLMLRAGLADISAARFESAIQRLNRVGGLLGWTPFRRVALGDAYFGQGDREAAIAQWEIALRDLPDDTALLRRLAENYEAVGRYPEAAEMFNRLGQAGAPDPAAYYRLAVYTAARAPADAVGRLAIVIETAPELAPAAQLLLDAIRTGQASGDEAYLFGVVGFTLLQLNEAALAETALARATILNPGYADAFAYLGLAQDRQGKDGAPALETAIRLAPDSPLAHFFLGLHFRRTGQSAAALPYLETAQRLDPTNPAIAAEIGGAYAASGDFVSAERWFVEAVNLEPDSSEFWLLLARFHVDNDYQIAEKGLPAARMAVGLNANSALAADAFGYALILTGDLANGQESLERALALDPELASAYFHLGVLYRIRNRDDLAEAAFKHTLALDPEGPYGKLAIQNLAQFAP